jgi:hypothetical protein
VLNRPARTLINPPPPPLWGWVVVLSVGDDLLIYRRELLLCSRHSYIWAAAPAVTVYLLLQSIMPPLEVGGCCSLSVGEDFVADRWEITPHLVNRPPRTIITPPLLIWMGLLWHLWFRMCVTCVSWLLNWNFVVWICRFNSTQSLSFFLTFSTASSMAYWRASWTWDFFSVTSRSSFLW